MFTNRKYGYQHANRQTHIWHPNRDANMPAASQRAIADRLVVNSNHTFRL